MVWTALLVPFAYQRKLVLAFLSSGGAKVIPIMQKNTHTIIIPSALVIVLRLND